MWWLVSFLLVVIPCTGQKYRSIVVEGVVSVGETSSVYLVDGRSYITGDISTAVAEAKRRALLEAVRLDLERKGNKPSDEELENLLGRAKVLRVVEQRMDKGVYIYRAEVEVFTDGPDVKVEKDKVLYLPSGPLALVAWVPRRVYRNGEELKVCVFVNRDAYLKVLYEMADGTALQIFPNPYHRGSLIMGGRSVCIPTEDMEFVLKVSPPFGRERILVYASDSPLGKLNTEKVGNLLVVRDEDPETRLRGIRVEPKKPVEWAQVAIELRTEP